MSETTRALERFSTRGEPRGATTVLRNAHALIEADQVSPAEVAGTVRPRHRVPLVLVAAVALLLLVGGLWFRTAHEPTGQTIDVGTSSGSRAWVENPGPGAFPKAFEEVARGSELGHRWIIVAHTSDGDRRMRLIANGLTGEITNRDNAVDVFSSRGGRSDAVYTWGVVPAGTSTVRITRDGRARQVRASGDPSKYGVRAFASVDTGPASAFRLVNALATDGSVIATTATGSP